MTESLSKSETTLGHRWIFVACLLGACFVVAHLVTVIVTCTVEGFNWGVNAWVLDVTGFLAAIFFAIQCWISSRKTSDDFRSANRWIFVWASMTFFVRIVDTLMLLGIVKWSAVYTTPVGAVLWSNIFSEIILGMAFTITALVGSLMLLKSPSTANRTPDLGSQ